MVVEVEASVGYTGVYLSTRRTQLQAVKSTALAFQAKQEVFGFACCRSFLPANRPVSSSSLPFSLHTPSPRLFLFFLFLAVRRCIPFPPNSPTSHASDNTLIEISLPTSGVSFFLFYFFLFFLSSLFFLFFCCYCCCTSRLLHLSESSSSYGSPSLTMSRFLMGCIVSASSSQQNGVGTRWEAEEKGEYMGRRRVQY